jgi:hypothetical protein
LLGFIWFCLDGFSGAKAAGLSGSRDRTPIELANERLGCSMAGNFRVGAGEMQKYRADFRS